MYNPGRGYTYVYTSEEMNKESIMSTRVTIQDIADALGVSRNTVSKAINNTGILADSTREKILQKAVEMGYKQFSYVTFTNMRNPVKTDRSMPTAGLALPSKAQTQDESAANSQAFPPQADSPTGIIAVLTTSFLGTSHFASPMLDKFESELACFNYGFAMYRVSQQDLENKTLPVSVNRETISGIICFEMFDSAYCDMLCSLDIPVLFADCPSPCNGSIPKADLLLMENRSGIFELVKEMMRRGKKRIGFIGEFSHCLSFYERYMGFRETMLTLGLPCQEEYCIVGNKNVPDPSADDYREYLEEKIRSLKELPDLFICANDFIALDVQHVLKNLGISVPDDVYLCGFDDSPESRVVTPRLTTIHIHSQIMGFSAVHLLLSRIKEPTLNYRTVYAETDLIYRESTGD